MKQLLIAAAIALASCGGGSSDARPIVNSTKGGAPPPTGTATLGWIQPADSVSTSQTGVRVYKSTSEMGLLDESARTLVTTIADTSTLTYVVTSLSSGTWFFCVAAYNATGEGACSQIVSVVVP